MKKVIITEASWSGDEKSVNLTIYDADKDVGVKENRERLTVEIGSENWEEENEEDCEKKIAYHLLGMGLFSENDFTIE